MGGGSGLHTPHMNLALTCALCLVLPAVRAPRMGHQGLLGSLQAESAESGAPPAGSGALAPTPEPFPGIEPEVQPSGLLPTVLTVGATVALGGGGYALAWHQGITGRRLVLDGLSGAALGSALGFGLALIGAVWGFSDMDQGGWRILGGFLRGLAFGAIGLLTGAVLGTAFGVWGIDTLQGGGTGALGLAGAGIGAIAGTAGAIGLASVLELDDSAPWAIPLLPIAVAGLACGGMALAKR